MITRIEIGYKPEIRDARGEAVAAMVDGYMKIPVERVRALEVYKIDGELGSGEKELAVKGFARYHKYSLGSDIRGAAHGVLRQVVGANAAAVRLPEILGAGARSGRQSATSAFPNPQW